MTIFDIVTLISKDKSDYSYKFENPEDNDDLQFVKQYNQFMINRILACNTDLIYLSVVADNLDVPDNLHYLFWHNIINKKFRFFRYPKKQSEDNSNVELISNYYNVSKEKAIELLELLDKEQVNDIKKTYNYGKR